MPRSDPPAPEPAPAPVAAPPVASPPVASPPATPPPTAAPSTGAPPAAAAGLAGRPLDSVDRSLLEALQVDGRASYAELARRVGLTAPSVQDRVRRLEERGVVLGYAARVAPAAVGRPVSALIEIELGPDADEAEVEAAMYGLEAIEDAWYVAGDEAYLVKARVADVAAISGILVALRGIPGVERTRTTVVLRTLWEGRPVPPA